MREKLQGHWKKYVADPKFLGAAELENMPEIAVTIDYTTIETVQNASGKAEKTVLHFKENVKPMVLNSTNAKTIAKLVHSPMVEKWTDVKIQLYFDPEVKFAGDMVGGVRVRPYPPRAGIEPVDSKPIPCEQCGNNIKPFGEMTTEQLAEYTKKKYGKALCSDCATDTAKHEEGK